MGARGDDGFRDRRTPARIGTTVAAIVAARLTAARLTPVADRTDSPLDLLPGPGSRPVQQASSKRALTECAGWGRPRATTAHDRCCLDWPERHTCTGPTPHRAHPDSDGRRATCVHTTAA
jgi:hypothetical protein